MSKRGSTMSEYSVEALVSFLEYAATKGLLNRSTASAKKIAVERVFEVADPNERADIRQADVGNIMARFINIAGAGFRPESLASYQSRVKSAIEDFVVWKQNPMGFRPSRRGAAKGGKSVALDKKSTAPAPAPPVSSAAALKPGTLSLPIPIRSDLTVQIDGIPYDLTKAEATKIANVVLAMATEI